ncbi:hypothetical protein GRF29_8g2378422 [Pseudopithomyces chartarum]|uniref:Uncharacterized protein n=1 Tax=Pseudopithomyces chartarum TaxID=1892770 RepID=A0AAN6M6M0_9PLEO|nr:hypothetical protein GRF29_8g2378422 [Pseudopithomyces chartarum]
MDSLHCADYHVAWICLVADIELLPAQLMLDERHTPPPYNTHYEENTYLCGLINGHAVVVATCPQGETGNVNVGRLTGSLFKTFPNIRMAVLVDIGGGIARPWVVPFVRPPSFAGRETQLAQLDAHISSEGGRRLASYGLGGCGKTALALEAAYRTRERQPARAVLWVPAVSRESFEQAYREIGERLSIPGIADGKVDIKRLDERTVAEFLDMLAFLALAIVQAVAFITTNDVAFSDYISDYRSSEEEAMTLLGEEFEDQGRYRDAKNPVATTWYISFRQIQKENKLAADYLSFMACIANTDIPASLLLPSGSRVAQTKAIGTLKATLRAEKGADVNAQGGKYGNALQTASAEGEQEIIRLLLEKGADVNAQGGYYSNALQAASWRGHQEIVRVLLEMGAEVNAQGGEYGSAFQAASRAGHKSIVAILSTAGSVVNAEDAQEDNSPRTFLTDSLQDAVRTASKEQSIFKALWQHVIPCSTMLWPALVLAITGGVILGLVRSRRIPFLVSEAVRCSGI